MKNLTISLVLLVLLNSTYAQNPGRFWLKYSTPEEAGFSSEKLQKVVDLCKRNGATALLVIYNGNVLISEGDISRRYDCHSIRKSLINSLYGIYSNSGKIDIHKSLNDLNIDDVIKLTEQEKSATIQDLLKSKSGIYIPSFGEDQSMKDSRPPRESHKPGSFFYYNNWDFNVLGQIFQNLTGKNLFKAFNESIAKPIRMEDFRLLDGRFWSDSSIKTFYPKYDIKMSARDLARFGTLFCNNGIWDKKQIIPKEWISESFMPYSEIVHKSYTDGYGYLWWIEKYNDTITMYSGLGWGGHILTIVPKMNLVLVKRHDTFNGTSGDGWGGMYIRALIQAKTLPSKPKPNLINLKIDAPKRAYINIPANSLKKYQQTFIFNGRDATIKYNKHRLIFADWFILHPVTEIKFYIEDLDKYMIFKFINNKPLFDKIE